MVPASEFSGSRLISYEFGIVADFPITLPYSAPYYLKLVFKKGDKLMTDVWAAKSQGFDYIPYLNKIVKSKENTAPQWIYTFTDDTVIVIT